MTSSLRAIAVGRLVPVKRFDVLIQAWKNIPSHLSIVGDGPERQRLTSLVTDLKMQDRVHFLGERNDVQTLMADFQLLVATSDREGFGYVFLEALQANLVVVSTATGIAADLIPIDYLIDPPSAERVSHTVKRTLREFELAKKDFESAWGRAKSLTVKKMVATTLSTYQDTLSRKSKLRSKK